MVRCGNVSLIISRLQPNLREFEWVTLARPWHGDTGRAGKPARLLPDAWHMSHNAATTCVNGTLHVFGGQYRNYTVGRGVHARGVFHAALQMQQRKGGEELSWSPPTLQLEGYHEGCVERRAKFKGYCEFDGLFSVAFFRERFMLFGRANMSPLNGARHVQMTSAPANLSEWSPFRVVQLPGVKVGRSDSNIYFFNVQVWGDRLVALFPAVFPSHDSAGIYMSSSADGVTWTRPQRLLPSAAFCARTRIHPVRLVRDLHVDYLYVLRNIDLSEPMDVHAGQTHARGATRPYLQRARVHVDRQSVLFEGGVDEALAVRLGTNATWRDVPVARVAPALGDVTTVGY